MGGGENAPTRRAARLDRVWKARIDKAARGKRDIFKLAGGVVPWNFSSISRARRFNPPGHFAT